MRTVCLATPLEDPERYQAAQRHFAERGLTVEYLWGLHKDTSGLVTTHPYMVDRGPGSPDEGIPYSIGPHPTNIWLGHWAVWQSLILSGDSEWFVIECDALFPPDWQAHFHMAMEAAVRGHGSDYDLIYMGSCCTTGRIREDHETWTIRGVGARDIERTLCSLAGTAPQCNHAYVVTARAARVMVQTLRKVWAPVDIQQASECWGDPLPRCVEPLSRPDPPLKVYAVLPRIVDQRGTDLTP